MKLKKNHCYVIGYVNRDGNHCLPGGGDTVWHWYYENKASLIDNMSNMYCYKDCATRWFLLESCDKAEMVDGKLYYFLYDSFGDGLCDNSCLNERDMEDDIFLKKNYKKARKKFDQYWGIDDEDQRCLFKIVPIAGQVQFELTKKLIEVENITVIINSKST